MGIYHPPKSTSNTSTVNLFFEELSDYHTENITNYEELIILGDTNIHYDLETDYVPLLHVHWLRLHCKYKIILCNFYLPLRFSSKLEDMKLTTFGIILWAVLAILIEIMLGKMSIIQLSLTSPTPGTQCNKVMFTLQIHLGL